MQADMEIPTLGAVIRNHSATRPASGALRFEGRSWTYAELDHAGDAIAGALSERGFKPGDRIAYLGLNSDLVGLLAVGLARAGLIFVPINWRLAPLEIAHILVDSGSRLLLTADGFSGPDHVASLAAETLLQWVEDDRAAPRVAVDVDATLLVIYTSGTTGLPKGVMLSSRSMFATSVLRRSKAMAWDDWGPDDVTLVSVPLAHIGGFGMVARTWFFGGEAVVLPQFDPGGVLDAIETHRISKLALVPTAMKMIIDHPEARNTDYSRIGTIVYGTSPITLDLLREAMGVFGCEFAQSYGMTETCGTCVVLPPEDHDPAGNSRMRAAGRALPGTTIRVVDPDGRELPVGQRGEIILRCPSMMKGYWGMLEETARVLDADGWYRTGDAGHLDEDGYLFISDRVKDMIVSGGENVYPAEVENVLVEHPDIAQVAVIGIPDALWGEAVKGVVVPQAGRTLDPEAIMAWAKQRLGGFKIPKSIDSVDALPINATGKVQKGELRKRYWAGQDRGVN